MSLFKGKSDRTMAVTVFALVLFGVVMIYSASIILGHYWYDDDRFFVKKQIFAAVLGFIGMAIMSGIDYHFWRRWAGWMLSITFLLLFSVFFFSKGEVNGAHRWITLGSLSFQPSELAKLTFIIYASAWLSERQQQIKNIQQTFVPYLVVLGAISLLVLKEPDFGTLTIILAAAIAIYYVAGLSWQQIGLGIIITIISLSIILASPYRRARLNTFLNPGEDKSNTAYHINNITIAIGSGGPWGLGFGESKQKRLFLPEPHTDSIFAIISEELGSVRSFLLILIFCFFIYRGFLVASRAPDLFGKLMAVGITTWFAFQAFINLGSMLHLVPLVGVPLPLISFGGTNLLISLVAIGLLLNISSFAVQPEVQNNHKTRRKQSV